MLISVHMPKAAGTTCLNLFENIYGDRLLRDYGDKILSNSIFSQRKNSIFAMFSNGLSISEYSQIDCIHGHFMPIKYRYFNSRDPFYLTWLRHPVQRLISHYHYWSREPLNKKAGVLRRRVVRERWSLSRFCLSEELRDIYSKVLWGFPLKKFNFIGVTEFFEEDMRFFSEKMFGHALETNSDNLNPDRDADFYSIDESLKKEIEDFHKKDIVLYQEALQLRLLR